MYRFKFGREWEYSMNLGNFLDFKELNSMKQILLYLFTRNKSDILKDVLF